MHAINMGLIWTELAIYLCSLSVCMAGADLAVRGAGPLRSSVDLLVRREGTDTSDQLACPFPPAVWCTSFKVASACGVVQQCSAFVWKQPRLGRPVDFTLYYESLCVDCKLFIKQQLWPAYKAVGQIMNLRLVPYGNAREYQKEGKWVFQCQHGPEECTGNLIETCAIHIVKNLTVYFPFIHCMEQSQDQPEVSFVQCAKRFGIDHKPIDDCVHSDLGNSLEHKMALETNKLDPAHTYVPWVTLNGVHTEDIQHQAQDNLIKLLCDAYQGPKPPACTSNKLHGCPRD